MKNNFLRIIVGALLFCTICSVCFTSCSDSPDKITNREITKTYNNYLKENALSQKFVEVNLGYYETSAEERCELKKLEAAGVIKVTYERFAWWEKSFRTKKVPVTTYDWWGFAHTSYTTKKTESYSFEDHIFANVSLTPAGEKLVVKELPTPVEKKDKDMEQPEFKTEEYPEYSVSCEENWPEIENPFLEKKEEPEPSQTKEQEKDSQSVQQKEKPVKEGENIERRDNSQYLAYEEAKNKENKSNCILKGCTVKAIKARNIQIVNENGISTAVAEVILENKNVSDAYRVQEHVISGMKTTKMVMLAYYLDKGWVIVEEPLMESMEKILGKWEKACSMMEKALKDNDSEDSLNVEELSIEGF